jgi:hypothetical protein
MKNYIYLVIAGLILISSCKDGGTSDNPTPSFKLISHTDCKSFIADSTPKDMDCIEYSYDSTKNILKIKHINAAFNCCPTDFTINVSVSNEIITVTEDEKSAGCKCNCIYDLEYEIYGLDKSKSYVMKIDEKLLPQNDDPILANLNFSDKSSGKVCFKRSGYPWGM